VLILVLAGATVAGDQPTVTYDRSLVSFDPAGYTASYADFDLAAVGQKVLVGFEICFVELNNGEIACSVGYRAGDQVRLGNFDIQDAFADIPTGVSSPHEGQVAAAIPLGDVGTEMVHPVDGCHHGGKRYASVLLFPVTVSQNGDVFFNESAVVRVGSRVIAPHELLAGVPIEADAVSNQAQPLRSVSGEAAVDYVIITASGLAAPLERFVRYKTSTGYRTCVVFIDDIRLYRPRP